jgi:hypothetical protein
VSAPVISSVPVISQAFKIILFRDLNGAVISNV